MEKSSLTSYSQFRYPKRKRTIRLKGSFEERNKYIRCWNCGFIVNTERDLGDPAYSGCYQNDPIVSAHSTVENGIAPVVTMERVDMVGVLIINGQDGDPVNDYYTARNPLVSRGCPFCGCTNLP